MGDARIVLEELISTPRSPIAAPISSTGIPHRTVWIVALVASFLLGFVVMWMGRAQPETVPAFSGTMLGGPETAIAPRVSPDGRLVAFQAMIDGQTQVAVMQPGSGDWTLLSRDRTRGIVSSLSWSPDGTRIYYGRVDGVPRGIFSIPAVGGEERLVLEDAACPEVLPDGSILVARLNEQRQRQLYRFWPDTGRLQGYPVMIPFIDLFREVHAFRDGKEAVLWGRSTDLSNADPNYYLSILDIESSQVRRVPGVDGFKGDEIRPVAGGADDSSVVTVSRSGDLHTVVRIPRDGGPSQDLISLSHSIWGLDVSTNGDLYVDQMSRTLEVAEAATDGRPPQTLLTANWEMTGVASNTIAMPDGRLLFSVPIGGRLRLLSARPHEKPSLFVQTEEETSGPLTMVGPSEVAFLLGSGAARHVAIASAADGRIVRRLEKADGAAIQALAALPNGRTLYYAAVGKIWSIPSTDGPPEFVRDGDSVAVDPGGRYLLIQLNQNDNVRFVRMPFDGAPEQALSFPGVRLATNLMASNAIGPGGAIVKNAAYSDSWPWVITVLSPNDGKVQRINLPPLDTQYVGWMGPDRIVAFAQRTNSTIWRLRLIARQ